MNSNHQGGIAGEAVAQLEDHLADNGVSFMSLTLLHCNGASGPLGYALRVNKVTFGLSSCPSSLDCLPRIGA